MELSLTTWQRVQLKIVLGKVQGDVSMIRGIWKILDILELTMEERALVGYQETSSPNGPTYQWEETGRAFELEFDDSSIALMRQMVRQFQGWSAAPERRATIEDLFDRLGIEEQ